MAAMAKGDDEEASQSDDPLTAMMLRVLPGLVTLGKYIWPLPDKGLVATPPPHQGADARRLGREGQAHAVRSTPTTSSRGSRTRGPSSSRTPDTWRRTSARKSS